MTVTTSPTSQEAESPVVTSIEAIAAPRLQHFDNLVSSPLLNGVYARTTEDSLVEDIACLRSLAARLSLRLNRLRCPIMRLPPEIIQLIIYAVVDAVERSSGGPKHWMPLGRVCHIFRTTLLGMHALWARNAFTSDFAANEQLLERAHDAPIVIKLSPISSLARLELALQHLHRAREIVIAGNIQLNTIIPGLHEQCLPSLKSLKLRRDTNFRTAAETVYSIPQTFSAPNLRHLEFRNVFVQSSQCWPTNLVSLKLHRSSHTDVSHLPSPESFLDILRSCVNLSELELKDYIPDLAQLSEAERNNPISLTSLRRLNVDQDRVNTLRLWRMLVISPSAVLKIAWEDEQSLEAHVEEASAFLAHVAAYNAVMPPVVSLQILGMHSESDNWLSFELLGAYCGTGDAQRLKFSDVEWTNIAAFTFVTDLWTGDELASAIARFSSIFQLSQILHLSIDSDIVECLSEAGLPPSYAHFKALQTLHLSFCKTPDAFTPLGELYTLEPSASAPTMLCPALKTLYISNDDAIEDTDESFSFSTLLYSLHETLSKRSESGVPVNVLELAFDTIEESDREYLSGVVDEIIFRTDP
ncbi:hypothetical protein PENSPDRAFT_759297 [Peniophora sp. CONT]|nr:hypothetical protein PENSPDRAFT_759297 [Peniophora sp. CONT]